MKTLYQTLIDYPLVQLEAMARLYGLSLPENTQAQAAEFLAQTLAAPEWVAVAIERCSPAARRALMALREANGRMKLAAFTRQYGKLRRFGPGRMAREQPWQNPATVSEELWYLGLIGRAFALAEEKTPVEFVYIPVDLEVYLPKLSGEWPTLHLKAIEQPPPIVHLSDSALLEDVGTLLSFVHTETVRVDRQGRWWRSHLRALNKRLLHPGDPDQVLGRPDDGSRLSFLLWLVMELGLVAADPRGRLRLAAHLARQWLEASPGEQWRSLWETWRDSTDWNDLCRVPTLRCARGNWQNEPAATRARFLAHLTGCQPQAWYAVDEFIATIKSIDPDFQRPDGNYDSWYIRAADSDTYLRGFASWDQVEGALIRYFLEGPIHWLGVLDIGVGEAGDLQAWRLNETGVALLSGDPAPILSSETPVQVESDFTVLVPIGCPLLDRFRIARVTVWQASGPPFRYRITRTALQRARAQGVQPADILTFLRRVTDGQLPENVDRALTHWAESSSSSS